MQGKKLNAKIYINEAAKCLSKILTINIFDKIAK